MSIALKNMKLKIKKAEARLKRYKSDFAALEKKVAKQIKKPKKAKKRAPKAAVE